MKNAKPGDGLNIVPGVHHSSQFHMSDAESIYEVLVYDYGCLCCFICFFINILGFVFKP